MSPLAYLPQYDSELGGTVLGAIVIAFGLLSVVTGRLPETKYRPRIVRLIGLAEILFGAGMIASSFLIDAESPDEPRPVDHWGDKSDLVVLAVWLALIAAIALWNLRKYFRG